MNSSIQKIKAYLDSEKEVHSKELEQAVSNMNSCDMNMLSTYVSRIETAKVKILVANEVLDIIESRPTLDKADFIVIMSETLLASTAHVQMDTATAKRASTVGTFLNTFSSTRF